MAGRLDQELTVSPKANADPYFKVAVLFRRGGNREKAKEALQKAMGLAVNEDSRKAMKEQWRRDQTLGLAVKSPR